MFLRPAKFVGRSSIHIWITLAREIDGGIFGRGRQSAGFHVGGRRRPEGQALGAAWQPVVLYFYPKDDTPGCTREACAFRDQHQVLKKLGAKVLGVSPDDTASHGKFRDKFNLNFPLLADPDHKVADKYGAWREKNMYGKKSMGIQRSTYLIDAEGKIAKVWKTRKRRRARRRGDRGAGRPSRLSIISLCHGNYLRRLQCTCRRTLGRGVRFMAHCFCSRSRRLFQEFGPMRRTTMIR